MMLNRRNQGAALLLALLFVAIFAAVAASMARVSHTNLRSSDALERSYLALAAAETGLRYGENRVDVLTTDITTEKGMIDVELAKALWQQIATEIRDDMGAAPHCQQAPQVTMAEGNITSVTIGPIAVGDQTGASTFTLTFAPHPLVGVDYDHADYQVSPYNASGGDNEFTANGEPVTAANPITAQWVRITCTGAAGDTQRAVQMDYRIDKTVRFAILSRNRVMIGRNVIIRGAIGSRYVLTDYRHGHPVQLRDNFHNLTANLDNALDAFVGELASRDMDGDNRLAVDNPAETVNYADPAAADRNNDGYIDAMDLFIGEFDGNGDGAVSSVEFSNGGTLVDEQLWRLINEAKYPAGTEIDWVNLRVRGPGQVEWTDASADLGQIDLADDYAKIHGKIVMKSTVSDWESGAAAGPYQEYYRGAIAPDPLDPATTFSAEDSELARFPPDRFDVTEYRARAVGDFQSQSEAPVANDPSQPAVFTPAGPGTLESVPYNSPYPYDYYARPVYENMVFENVSIPKGTNALFVNCKFVGVTFVDTEINNDDPNFNYAGMQNADGSFTYSNVTAEVEGQPVTDTKPLGNNIRFDDCTFEGVVVTESPTTYTHARNKLQFTGNTVFDIDAPSLTYEEKALFERSTILAPQHSIDMGTFTDPTTDGVTHLEGAIVAGVLDVRGQAVIDGAIITTFEPTPGQAPLIEGGNPANFNTTIGYFESTAGDAEAEIPDGGFGRILIRYDPSRPLPDGIVGPIELRGEQQTWKEVAP